MNKKGIDELDAALMSIISNNEELSPAEIHEKVLAAYPRKVSRAIVWSRLAELVELGIVERVQTEELDHVKVEYVCAGKT